MNQAGVLEGYKRAAALSAVALVQSGMTVGLGTGSTVRYVIEALGQRIQTGDLENIVAVPTSHASELLAREVDIPLVELNGQGVDLAIDGADEITPQLDLIKGLGGALVREKVVATRAKMFVVVADASKRVESLGEHAPVPVEVIPFAAQAVSFDLSDLGAAVQLRRVDALPFVSDNGNWILDANFGPIPDPWQLDALIGQIAGVVGTGLFLGLAHMAFIADAGGVISI